tara:strand:+ start:25457 stop:25630 length:174 start_codon:yes stop_codon:yes gene_type:complete
MDIQRVLISIDDLRGDMGRLRSKLGSIDTMLLGLTILLGVNCVATIILGIAVWNNGG